MKIPIDKQLHFFTLAMLTAWLYILTGSVLISSTIALTIGGLKELVWDKYLGKGTPDKYDMAANAIGVLATAIIIVIGETL